MSGRDTVVTVMLKQMNNSTMDNLNITFFSQNKERQRQTLEQVETISTGERFSTFQFKGQH